jgi:hypothetical protein
MDTQGSSTPESTALRSIDRVLGWYGWDRL